MSVQFRHLLRRRYLLWSAACTAAVLWMALSADRPEPGQLARAADEEAVPAGLLAEMPVREVTVFKDGHAFVLHEGRLPTDSQGNVRLDRLPNPVLGTFWPYAAQEGARLHSVAAGKVVVQTERTALNTQELILANVGAKVFIAEGNRTFAATIVGVPQRDGAEIEAADRNAAGPHVAVRGQVVLLRTAEGVRVMDLAAIREITFADDPNQRLSEEQTRNLLTLHLDWQGEPQRTANVGMGYLQKGIRWIPQYRVTLGDNGKARLELQAAILNELTDLVDAKVHLVIGVPTFDFKDTADPIGLGQTVASLSPYFHSGPQTQYMLSNAIMTQTARMSEFRARAQEGPAPLDLGPEIGDGQKEDDLYIFTIDRVTLKRGQRLVLPVSSQELSYDDIYTLELPLAPPAEVRGSYNTSQQQQVAQLLRQPKVQHKVRLHNTAAAPLTTAPALILRGKRLLGQGMMTYASRGGVTDLTITAAVDVQFKHDEREVKRTPNAIMLAGDNYDRIDLEGKITLVNHQSTPVKVEVSRQLLGAAAEVGADGQATKLFAPSSGGAGFPVWWQWYSWPHWWHRLNQHSRIDWTVEVDAGGRVELPYSWHYFWR